MTWKDDHVFPENLAPRPKCFISRRIKKIVNLSLNSQHCNSEDPHRLEQLKNPILLINQNQVVFKSEHKSSKRNWTLQRLKTNQSTTQKSAILSSTYYLLLNQEKEIADRHGIIQQWLDRSKLIKRSRLGVDDLTLCPQKTRGQNSTGRKKSEKEEE